MYACVCFVCVSGSVGSMQLFFIYFFLLKCLSQWEGHPVIFSFKTYLLVILFLIWLFILFLSLDKVSVSLHIHVFLNPRTQLLYSDISNCYAILNISVSSGSVCID